MAELQKSLFEKSGAGARIGDIGREIGGMPAQRANLFTCGTGIRTSAMTSHVRTCLRQRHGNGRANSAARASDQGSFAVKPKRFETHGLPPGARNEIKTKVAYQTLRTNLCSVACVLRTNSRTRSMPTNGISPARIISGSNKCVPVASRESDRCPANSKTTIVPIAAPVPLKPLTEATDSAKNKSE